MGIKQNSGWILGVATTELKLLIDSSGSFVVKSAYMDVVENLHLGEGTSDQTTLISLLQHYEKTKAPSKIAGMGSQKSKVAKINMWRRQEGKTRTGMAPYQQGWMID
ncbi:hypothetical protein Lal_00029514 [Lupinus albus]|nr:hypothetical protein Lal_00029514 [Lupinus albus]